MTDKLKAWQRLFRFTASYSSLNCDIDNGNKMIN